MSFAAAARRCRPGSGAVIQGRGRVTGITTGASMWVAGAIGIATGLGHYPLAALTTALAFGVLFVLGKLEWFAKTKVPPQE